MLRFVLFALLVAVPIAEIATFLVVGSVIGVLPTILVIIGTAIAGAILLRRQGLEAILRVQADAKAGRVPAASIGNALVVGIAGVLLLTPGFITDTVGILLFIPALRRTLWRRIARSVKVDRLAPRPRPGPYPRTHGRTIELNPEEYGPADPSTPWRGGDPR